MNSEIERCMRGIDGIAKRLHTKGEQELADTLETYVSDLRAVIVEENQEAESKTGDLFSAPAPA